MLVLILIVILVLIVVFVVVLVRIALALLFLILILIIIVPFPVAFFLIVARALIFVEAASSAQTAPLWRMHTLDVLLFCLFFCISRAIRPLVHHIILPISIGCPPPNARKWPLRAGPTSSFKRPEPTSSSSCSSSNSSSSSSPPKRITIDTFCPRDEPDGARRKVG